VRVTLVFPQRLEQRLLLRPFIAKSSLTDPLEQQVMSTLSENSWKADGSAFGALPRHVREFDAHDHTVLMAQVENEVGILGDSRDRSETANRAFAGQVPKELMQHLIRNDKDLGTLTEISVPLAQRLATGYLNGSFINR
jgi:hypothetical protein